MKYDVFISYSSKDQKVVEAMCAYLEQHKVRCFVAYRDIPKGVVWAKAIVEALDESKMMVVVFSEEFNLSDQVDREIELASEDKKPILTFRISDAMFKGAKKYYLKNINWIDAFPHPEKVFNALLDNVCKLIGCPFTFTNTESVSNCSIPVAKPVEKTWKVGDYYNVNGKEGVVFWIDKTGTHGKIVSLDQAKVQWCTTEEFKKEIKGIAVDKRDGINNLLSIQNICNWRSKYPAFAWCADHGDDWYLPAIEELDALLLDKVVSYIMKVQITSMGGTKIFSRGFLKGYWSSTETDESYAEYVDIGFGMTNIAPKVCDYYVRAVSCF